MKKIFKKIIGFMLAASMLIVSLSGTAMAVNEQISAAEICGFNTASARTQLLANDTYVARSAYKSEYAEPWILMYDSMYGCFRIQDADTGYYLTAPEMPVNGEYVTKELLSGSLESRQLWSFAVSSSGYYVIQSQNMEWSPYVLTLNVYSDELVVTDYSDDTNYCDEWEIIPFAGWVKLNILRDSAYNQRFEYSSSRIRACMATMQKTYLDEFGIYVDYGSIGDLSYTYIDDYASYPEQNVCTTCTYDQLCTCVANAYCEDSYAAPLMGSGISDPVLMTYHHTNVYNILYRIPFPDMTQSLTMLFSGHRMCKADNHSTHSTMGMAVPLAGISMIMNFNSEASEQKTVVHEFGHLFDAPDHYGIGNIPTTQEQKNKTGDNRYNRQCIYGEDKDSSYVQENLIICDGCKAVIQANANKFYHGN